jgi:hypothetical protein
MLYLSQRRCSRAIRLIDLYAPANRLLVTRKRDAQMNLPATTSQTLASLARAFDPAAHRSRARVLPSGLVASQLRRFGCVRRSIDCGDVRPGAHVSRKARVCIRGCRTREIDRVSVNHSTRHFPDPCAIADQWYQQIQSAIEAYPLHGPILRWRGGLQSQDGLS